MELPGFIAKRLGPDKPIAGGGTPDSTTSGIPDFLSEVDKQIIKDDEAIRVRFPERNPKRGIPPVFEMVINDGERDRTLWAIVGQAWEEKTGAVTDAYFFVSQEGFRPLDLPQILDSLSRETIRGTIWIADRRLGDAITQKDTGASAVRTQKPVELPRMALFVGNYNALLRATRTDMLKAVDEGRNVLVIPDPEKDREKYNAVWKAIINGGNAAIRGIVARTTARKAEALRIKTLETRNAELTALSRKQAADLAELRKQKERKPNINDLLKDINTDPYHALDVITADHEIGIISPLPPTIAAMDTAVEAAKRILLIAEKTREAEGFVRDEKDPIERDRIVSETHPPQRFRAALQLTARRKAEQQPRRR